MVLPRPPNKNLGQFSSRDNCSQVRLKSQYPLIFAAPIDGRVTGNGKGVSQIQTGIRTRVSYNTYPLDVRVTVRGKSLINFKWNSSKWGGVLHDTYPLPFIRVIWTVWRTKTLKLSDAKVQQIGVALLEVPFLIIYMTLWCSVADGIRHELNPAAFR